MGVAISNFQDESASGVPLTAAEEALLDELETSAEECTADASS